MPKPAQGLNTDNNNNNNNNNSITHYLFKINLTRPFHNHFAHLVSEIILYAFLIAPMLAMYAP
jgi:hypothetical protein